MSYDIRKWTANTSTRRRRRPVGWVLLAAIAVAVTLSVLAAADPGSPMLLVSRIALVCVMLVWSFSPYARESWFTTRGLAAFDEFERAALFRATTRAYLVLVIAISAMLLWVTLGTIVGWSLPDLSAARENLLLTTLVVAVVLPVAIAEVTVPFPPADEADEAR